MGCQAMANSVLATRRICTKAFSLINGMWQIVKKRTVEVCATNMPCPIVDSRSRYASYLTQFSPIRFLRLTHQIFRVRIVSYSHFIWRRHRRGRWNSFLVNEAKRSAKQLRSDVIICFCLFEKKVIGWIESRVGIICMGSLRFWCWLHGSLLWHH